jgi:hypothetical protein
LHLRILKDLWNCLLQNGAIQKDRAALKKKKAAAERPLLGEVFSNPQAKDIRITNKFKCDFESSLLQVSANAEDFYDHGRVGGDVGGDGVVGPQVDQGVGGAQSEVGLHESGGKEGEQDENDGEQRVGNGII